MKPDPTMLLCYVPDLVFTINRDAPFIYRGALCGMRNVRDILIFYFSDRIYMDCRDVFPVFQLDKDCVVNWLLVGVTKFSIDINKLSIYFRYLF